MIGTGKPAPDTDRTLRSRADELSLFLRNRAGATGPINDYDKILLLDASALMDELMDLIEGGAAADAGTPAARPAVLWITNHAESLESVMPYTFPAIWNAGRPCRVVMTDGPERAADLEEKIRFLFRDWALSRDDEGWNPRGTAYAEHEALRTGPLASVVPVSEIGTMDIPDGSAVVLDVALVPGDAEAMRDMEPTTSMKAYGTLSKRGIPCWLYASTVAYRPFLDGWRDVYARAFGPSGPVPEIAWSGRLDGKHGRTDALDKFEAFVAGLGRPGKENGA